MHDRKYPFGKTIAEMDVEAFFNIRKFVEEALVSKGAKMQGGGIGFGQADLDFTVDGAPFNVSIRPRIIGPVDDSNPETADVPVDE